MEKIFGYDWSEIQAMQRGTYVRPIVSGNIARKEATEADKILLNKHGVSGLRNLELFGVIYRLECSGLVGDKKCPEGRH